MSQATRVPTLSGNSRNNPRSGHMRSSTPGAGSSSPLRARHQQATLVEDDKQCFCANAVEACPIACLRSRQPISAKPQARQKEFPCKVVGFLLEFRQIVKLVDIGGLRD